MSKQPVKCDHKDRCPICHKKEWFLRRKEALEELVHMLEANANCLFNDLPRQRAEWNMLLGMRDKLKKHVDKNYNESKEPK